MRALILVSVLALSGCLSGPYCERDVGFAYCDVAEGRTHALCIRDGLTLEYCSVPDEDGLSRCNVDDIYDARCSDGEVSECPTTHVLVCP